MKKMKVALFGAGQIAKMQAEYICERDDLELAYVYDPRSGLADELAARTGALALTDPEPAVSDGEVELVFICTSTASHCDLIKRCALAGKRVYCEKPISEDLQSAYECGKAIRGYEDKVHIGFNRRFDKNNLHIYNSLKKRELGELEMLFISSRDWTQLTAEYLKTSGGIFHDVTIHDFDLAGYFLSAQDDEIVSIYAEGSALFQPTIMEQLASGEKIDYDSTMVVMRSKKGRLIHINTSRRAAYGYDQRIEALCSKGMLMTQNVKQDDVLTYTEDYTEAGAPLLRNFMERYRESFRTQLADFVQAAKDDKPVVVGFKEALYPMILAEKAVESARAGKPVEVSFI